MELMVSRGNENGGSPETLSCMATPPLDDLATSCHNPSTIWLIGVGVSIQRGYVPQWNGKSPASVPVEVQERSLP